MEKDRETLSSRLGFILLSAGCAIGLGNVWRFPYITGKNGGGAFVLIYLCFLLLLGLPIMVMEFSIGRASRQQIALSLKTLEPEGTKWHCYSPFAIAGNYLLMMFYTTIAGWLFCYFLYSARGTFSGATVDEVASFFQSLTSSPLRQIFWMALSVSLSMLVVSKGVQKGVERISKWMMLALLLLMSILAVNSVFLEGGSEGLGFYLRPDFSKLQEIGIGTVVYEALAQSFFTLSLGIGSMSIFGSYLPKQHTLTGESVRIIILDTFVALTSGLIIFPACSAFGVSAGQGPSLIFITLPNIFSKMRGGAIWASLFFLFMSFAAFSTLIAVFENIVAYWIDVKHWQRSKACILNTGIIILLSLPCILGFNVLSSFQPFGEGSGILDLEDFLVSNLIIPSGSLLFVLFCTQKKGWGFEAFLEEANTGKGMKFPSRARRYCTYIIPAVILMIMIRGIIGKFG